MDEFREFIDKLNMNGLPQQADQPETDWARMKAKDMMLWWFGTVLGDKVPFNAEVGEQLIANILTRMREFPAQQDWEHREVVMAMCAGFLADRVLDPLKAVLAGFMAGRCYQQMIGGK